MRRTLAALLVLLASVAGAARGQRVGRDSAHALPLQPIEASARRRGPRVDGKFRPVVDSTTLADGLPTRAAGQWLSLSAEGMVRTPSPCYRLAGAADRTGAVVTLNVQARPDGDLCPAAPAAFTYKVSLRGLPPGTYTFRVLHTFRDAAQPPAMALDTTVTVRRARRTDFSP